VAGKMETGGTPPRVARMGQQTGKWFRNERHRSGDTYVNHRRIHDSDLRDAG
jgi:hypothetical protein